ncbi:wax ester/triacylglycerol synthase domain-containing protein [Propionicicella superfundia]|uniref:wax ester/triacylglycerol synthase domain-containing protein n=1 Tax=Propionicicella superfundia TaxID=348582 RepID=UPI0012EB6E6E|nr:wax ester/triacylglycerol synthase domain-containing protein [Propionicicella superfundia]
MGEPLTGLEAALWARGTTWQVVTVCTLRGAITQDDVVAQFGQRIAYAPRWRRIVRQAMLAANWIDDPSFDLGRHVREIPARDLSGLSGIVSGLLESPLPEAGSPWEAVLVSAGSRRSALIVRAAPALVDGYDHIHLLQESLDEVSTPVDRDVPEWVPQPEPASDLAADAMTTLLRGIRDPRRLLSRAQAGVELVADGIAHTVAPHSPGRQLIGSLDVPLDLLRQIRKRNRTTTHDVLLALVAGGYAAWLTATGQPLADKIAQIPLATREADVLGSAIGSRIAPQWMALPLTLTDPVDRLQLIASLTRARIDSRRLVSARDLSSLAGFAAPTIAAVAAGTVAAGRPWDILVANVPGPETPRFFGPVPVSGCHQLIGAPAPGAVTATITSHERTAGLDVVVPSLPDAFVAGAAETLTALSAI